MARKSNASKKKGVRLQIEGDENFVDDGSAPEIYADGFKSVLLNNGVVKLNLFSIFMNLETNETVNKVVARLLLPLPVMISFHDTLGTVIDKMKADGVIEETAIKDSPEE